MTDKKLFNLSALWVPNHKDKSLGVMATMPALQNYSTDELIADTPAWGHKRGTYLGLKEITQGPLVY